MTDEIDLERMFAAQRTVDETLVPPFDEFKNDFGEESHVDRAATQPRRVVLPLFLGRAAIVLCLLMFIGIMVTPGPQSSPTTDVLHRELEQLDAQCDAMLKSIGEMEITQAVAQHPDPEVSDQKMAWRTETDSLIPFESLTFNTRNLP